MLWGSVVLVGLCGLGFAELQLVPVSTTDASCDKGPSSLVWMMFHFLHAKLAAKMGMNAVTGRELYIISSPQNEPTHRSL
jgi:hypothetical protein